MYWYILFSLIVVAILSGVLIYYYSYEGFQSSSTEEDLSGAALLSPDNFDTSGVNINSIAQIMTNAVKDLKEDRRPVDNGPRLCEGFINQIAAMEESMTTFRATGDWNNVRITTQALKEIRQHQTEAGCQNNNT